MKRIVQLPYGYHVAGTEKGRRKVEAYPVLDTFPAEIDVVSSDEAPVVLVVDYTHYRRWNGVLMAPAPMPFGGGDYALDIARPFIPFRAPALDDFADTFQMRVNARLPATAMKNYPIELPVVDGRIWGNQPDDLQLSRVHSSDQEDRLNAAAVAASGLTVIDDVVHYAVPEPVLLVRCAEFRRGGATAVLSIKDISEANRLDAAYRIDQVDEAMAYAAHVARGAGHRLNATHVLHDPLGWTFDGLTHGVRQIAGFVMNQIESLSGQAIHADASFLLAFSEFRDVDVHEAPTEVLMSHLLRLRAGLQATESEKAAGIKRFLVPEVDDIAWRWTQAGLSLDMGMSELDDLVLSSIGGP